MNDQAIGVPLTPMRFEGSQDAGLKLGNQIADFGLDLPQVDVLEGLRIVGDLGGEAAGFAGG